MEGDEPQGATEQPKILKNVTGWIGGLTGVVIALAGLRAAYEQFIPKQGERPQLSAPANDVETTPASEDASTSDAPEGAAALPLSYSGGGYQMDWKDGVWVETDSDGKVRPYEQQSRDDTDTFVIDRASNVRWRWPNEGGAVQSFDEAKQEWVDSGIAYAPVASDQDS